jgi:hypothetical protein
MSEVTALARRYAIDINTGTTAAPVWSRLLGVREFSPAIEPTHEDDSLYEHDGWVGNVRTALAWSAEVVISHRVDATTGAFNAVHRFVRNSAMKFGVESIVGVRYFDRNGAADDAWAGEALVTWEPEGGEHGNPDRITITFTGNGPLEAITNPVTVTP